MKKNADSDFESAARAVLQPLVRHLVANGLTYPALAESLKRLYVSEVVRQETERAGAVTDSRVSLLTGVHRKDVKRFRTLPRGDEEASSLRPRASLAARVVAEWVSNPKFLDSRGRPRPLPLKERDRRAAGFDVVVAQARADMRPATVLDELVRAGVAEVKDGQVHLLRNAYVSTVPADKLAFLAANVGDHLRAALENVAGRETPFLERAVYYGLVDAAALTRLQAEITRRAERFLREINRLVMPLNTAARRGPPARGRRMRLGVYYYEDDAAAAPASRKSGRKRNTDGNK